MLCGSSVGTKKLNLKIHLLNLNVLITNIFEKIALLVNIHVECLDISNTTPMQEKKISRGSESTFCAGLNVQDRLGFYMTKLYMNTRHLYKNGQ